MKRAVLLFLIFGVVPAWADMWARAGHDYMHLTMDPCPHSILALLKPESHGLFKAAIEVLDGVSLTACWALDEDDVFVAYEDGQAFIVSLKSFQLEGRP